MVVRRADAGLQDQALGSVLRLIANERYVQAQDVAAGKKAHGLCSRLKLGTLGPKSVAVLTALSIDVHVFALLSQVDVVMRRF